MPTIKIWEQFIIKCRIKWVWCQNTLLCCTCCWMCLNVNSRLLLSSVPRTAGRGAAGSSAHARGEQVGKPRRIYPALLCLPVELSDGSSKGFRRLIFFNLSPYISTSFIRKKGEKSILCWNRLPPALLPNVSKSQWKGLAPDVSAGPINHSQKYRLNPTYGANQQE